MGAFLSLICLIAFLNGFVNLGELVPVAAPGKGSRGAGLAPCRSADVSPLGTCPPRPVMAGKGMAWGAQPPVRLFPIPAILECSQGLEEGAPSTLGA